MHILRNALYTDKVLAIIREYSANAWDAHRDAGSPDRPIKVMIPTFEDPTLSIRDFGEGLSQDEIFRIYTQYGASTKRDSDVAVGMLGIGSKSGFAYSDSFTITSFNKGTKSIYTAALDASNKGVINLMHEEPTDETGILIQIAVRPGDIPQFERKAREFFKYFLPRPDINIEVPELPKTQKNFKNGILYEDLDTYTDRGWVAVMGCVSYRVNANQLEDFEEGLPTFVKNSSGALYFDIGDVQISASREELEYTERTKRKLIDRFNDLVTEYVEQVLEDIRKNATSPWDKRIRAQIFQQLGLPTPPEFKDFVSGYVRLKGKTPEHLVVENQGKYVDTINIAQTTRLILRDDNRALKGFGLGERDYLIRKLEKKKSWDDTKTDLDKMLVDLALTGIKIEKTSELAWTQPMYYGSKTNNVKHRVKSFKLKMKDYYRHPYSDGWDAIEREPTDDDIFVILENFRADYGVFYSEAAKLYRVSQVLGKQIPEVYGYKSTATKPVRKSDCKGTPFKTWYEGFYRDLLDDKLKEQILEWVWAEDVGSRYNAYSESDHTKVLARIEAKLGTDHELYELFDKHYTARKKYRSGYSDLVVSLFRDFRDRVIPSGTKSEPVKAVERLQKKYPLICTAYQTLSIFTDSANAKHWLEYIRLMDLNKEENE